MQLLTLHLEILAYILFLLYGFLYFRSIGDLIGLIKSNSKVSSENIIIKRNVGSLSCFSLILTANLAVISIEWVLTIDLSSVEIRLYVLVLPSSCFRVLI